MAAVASTFAGHSTSYEENLRAVVQRELVIDSYTGKGGVVNRKMYTLSGFVKIAGAYVRALAGQVSGGAEE
jgi:hypothetical protein